MSDNRKVLILPIQINGDLSKQTTPNNLLERELYISSGGYLYYGDNRGSTKAVTVKNSDTADKSETTKSIGQTDSPIEIDYRGNNVTARIGYVNINNTINQGGTNEWNGCESDVQTILKNFKINNLKQLTLSRDLYGSNPNSVSNPQVGQIYFRI